jgi:hypothetical protein
MTRKCATSGSLSMISDHQSILNRLARIEAALGITEDPQDHEDIWRRTSNDS